MKLFICKQPDQVEQRMAPLFKLGNDRPVIHLALQRVTGMQPKFTLTPPLFFKKLSVAIFYGTKEKHTKLLVWQQTALAWHAPPLS
jgi:hypothetical protein